MLDLELKFRAKGLDEKDEPQVRKIVVESEKFGQLLSYIYIYGRSFRENAEVLAKCKQFLTQQTPGLTAVCMRVTIDYWNKYENYYQLMERFLDLDLFEEWYDEIIFTVGFVDRRKADIQFPKSLVDRFQKLVSDPRAQALDIL